MSSGLCSGCSSWPHTQPQARRSGQSLARAAQEPFRFLCALALLYLFTGSNFLFPPKSPGSPRLKLTWRSFFLLLRSVEVKLKKCYVCKVWNVG